VLALPRLTGATAACAGDPAAANRQSTVMSTGTGASQKQAAGRGPARPLVSVTCQPFSDYPDSAPKPG